MYYSYGNSVQAQACPYPTTSAQDNAVFDNTADLLASAFSYAHQYGNNLFYPKKKKLP